MLIIAIGFVVLLTIAALCLAKAADDDGYKS